MQVRFGAQYGLFYDPTIPKPMVERLNQSLMGAVRQSPSHRHVMETTSDNIRLVVKPVHFPATRNFAEKPFGGGDMLDIAVETQQNTFSSNPLAPGSRELSMVLSTRTLGVYHAPQHHEYLTVDSLTSPAFEGQRLLQGTVNRLMSNVLLVDTAYKAVAQATEKLFQAPPPPNPDVQPLTNVSA